MKIKIFGALIFLCCILLMLSGCATSVNPVTKEKTHNSYTIEQDIELGKSALQHNIAKMRKDDVPVNEDKKMVENLEMIVRRIASVSDLPDLPYTVTLFQCDIVNAAAAPGGALMVYQGLYDPEEGLIKNNLELAAVIAHEIAHVNCRHTTEELSKSDTISTVGKVLSVGVSVVAGIAAKDASIGKDAGKVFDNVFKMGAGLWFPSYSRKQELEADRVGLMYLAKARIDPRPALEIWKRAAEKSKKEKNSTSIYDSHPPDEERFRQLEKYLPEAMKVYEEAGGDSKAALQVSPFDSAS